MGIFSDVSSGVDSVNGEIGAVVLDADDIAVGATNKYATAAEKAKLALIAITQAVDLDQLELDLAALNSSLILQTSLFDASGGAFPGGGVAQRGYVYIVSVAGTVDGVAFGLGDRIVALADNASTATFLGNWFKEDYTDAVLSIDGQTGAVTIVTQVITDGVTNRAPSENAVFDALALKVKTSGGGEELVQTHGNTGATETIDVANGNVHVVTQDQACVYTFTNPANATAACSFTLIMTAVTGAATWPASVNWPSGVAPTLTGRCILTFVTVNGGTDWDGFLSGSGMA